MTTAARPTWAPVMGGNKQGGAHIFGPSQKYLSRDVAAHTTLKPRLDFETVSRIRLHVIPIEIIGVEAPRRQKLIRRGKKRGRAKLNGFNMKIHKTIGFHSSGEKFGFGWWWHIDVSKAAKDVGVILSNDPKGYED